MQVAASTTSGSSRSGQRPSTPAVRDNSGRARNSLDARGTARMCHGRNHDLRGCARTRNQSVPASQSILAIRKTQATLRRIGEVAGFTAVLFSITIR